MTKYRDENLEILRGDATVQGSYAAFSLAVTICESNGFNLVVETLIDFESLYNCEAQRGAQLGSSIFTYDYHEEWAKSMRAVIRQAMPPNSGSCQVPQSPSADHCHPYSRLSSLSSSTARLRLPDCDVSASEVPASATLNDHGFGLSGWRIERIIHTLFSSKATK